MLRKKRVILHTEADLDQAQRLLEAQVAKGSTAPNHPIDTLKDTLRTDDKPFRGEVGPGNFKLTRRRRGKNAVRIQLEGQLVEKKAGGTEIHATMSAPPTLIAGLFAGLLALIIAGGGTYAAGAPSWLPFLVLLAEIPALGLASFLYDQETSATFSALRDAIPEHPPQPISELAAPAENARAIEAAKVPER